MKKLLDILKKPNPYYIPFSRTFKLLIFLSMIIPFLIVFKPFGLSLWEYEYKHWVLMGMTLPIFLTLVVNFYGMVKLLPNFFDDRILALYCLHGSNNCDHCVDFKAQLDSVGFTYDFRDVEFNDAVANEMYNKVQAAKIQGRINYPVIDVDGKIMVAPSLSEVLGLM